MNDNPTGKRLFLGLLLAAGGLLGGGGLILWWLPRVLPAVQAWFPAAVARVLAAAALLILAGIGMLAFAILFERDLPGTRRLRGILVRGLFPTIVGAARLLRIPKEKVERSFVAVNNQLVVRSGRRAPPEKILILLPHCLQADSCDIRITGDVNDCRACGRCPIAGLTSLGHRYGVHLSAATGGTIARRITVEQRPQMIIAVACERDLTSGIHDAHPLPVYGILNDRPHGPRFNTLVDLERVETGLQRVVAESRRSRSQAPQGTWSAGQDPPPEFLTSGRKPRRDVRASGRVGPEKLLTGDDTGRQISGPFEAWASTRG